MPKLITRTTRMHIIPIGEPIFSELGYTIEIDDESGGEFIRIKDGSTVASNDGVAIDPEAWPAVRDAVERLIEDIKKHEKGEK